MLLPLFGLLFVLIVQTGLLLTDVVVAHGIAREVGRTAALQGDAPAREAADRLADGRDLDVELSDDDGFVTAEIALSTPAFAAVGVDLTVPATATFRREAAAALDTGVQ